MLNTGFKFDQPIAAGNFMWVSVFDHNQLRHSRPAMPMKIKLQQACMALTPVEQWAAPIPARNLRILDAALDAGVPFSHGCNTGGCGSCKTSVLDGDVRMDSYSPDALTAVELSQDVILVCHTRAVVDV